MPHRNPEVRKKYCREYHRRWYAANREKKLAQNMEWARNNRDRVRKINRASYRRTSTRPVFVPRTPEQRKMTKLRSWCRKSWKRYGIDPAQAAAALAAHNGFCDVCGADKPATRRRDWAIDHDHLSGRVRGVLCHSCNMKLGWVERVGLGVIQTYLRCNA